MNCKNAFIPLEVQCLWCGGQMERTTIHLSGTLNYVTYLCKQCGGIAQFVANDRQAISCIEVEYKSSDTET